MRYMRKLFILLCGAFLLGTAMIAFAKYSECTNKLPRVEKRGYLIIGMVKQDLPPFFMRNKNGSLTGSDVTLARSLANALHVGVKFDRQYETFNQVIDAVKNNKVDLGVSFLTDTPLRETKVSFSRPYAEVKQNLIVSSEKWKYLKHISNLPKSLNASKAKVALLRESAYVSLARELFPDAEVIALPSLGAVVKAVKSEQALVGIVNDVELKSLSLKQSELMQNVEIYSLEQSIDKIAMAVSLEDCDLLEYVNQFLEHNKVFIDVDRVFEEYRSYFR